MRRVNRYILLAIGVFTLSFLLRASLPQVATGSWGSANSMSSLHDGGCSVLLQDGRILVSGGSDASGPTAKVDIFNTDGTWSSESPMLSPRVHQVCVVLQSGQVLVAGGITTGGGITNSAEILDSSTNIWSQLPPMGEARAGATASTLPDGRILVAGGQTSSGPSDTVEIFDPNAGTFSFAGTMSASRQDAAATLLQDGRVLIIGGSGLDANGNTAVLGSSDIYDPNSGVVSPGPTLTTARSRHSATTQLDGRVVVIGGSNGSTDLASIEVFDPSVGGNFAPVSASLATPRSGHFAFLLPKNNEVLVGGGQSDASGQEIDTATAELYVPWGNQGAGAVQTTGSMSIARSQASGAPLSIVDGLLMMAGGSSQTSAELYSFATVKSDQSDYAPGTTVTITGTGWQPGETVTLTLVETPLIDTHPTMTAVADQNGNIFNNQFSPDSYDVSVRFYLTATGSQSQAQNTFTDSVIVNTSVASNNNPSVSGQSVTFTASATQQGNGNPITCGTVQFKDATTNLGSPVSLNGSGQALFTTSSLSAGSHQITAAYASAAGCPGNNPGTATALTQQVSTGTATKLAFAAQPSNATVDQLISPAVTLQLEDANGIVVNTSSASVSLTISPGGVLSGTTQVSASHGIATFSNLAVGPVGTYTLSASSSGLTGATSASFTISAANTNTTLLSSSNPSVFGQLVTFTASVANANNSSIAVTEGCVQFMNGGSALSSKLSLAGTNGSVAYSTSTLAANSSGYNITANYMDSGTGCTGANYKNSTSNVVTQVVGPDNSSIAVSSSPNPVVQGSSVTFTATVTNTAAGISVSPTGTVQFHDGASAIGSAQPLNANGTGQSQAQYSTSLLTVGTHSITASYVNSDGDFSNSTSSALSEVVNSPCTPASVTTPPSNVTVSYGQAATFSVVVAGTTPLTYQWLRNGVVIAGANASSYSFSPAVSDSGTVFSVQVSNSCTSLAVTSSSANLTVNPASATVTLGNLAQTYTGYPEAVSVTTNPAGLSTSVTYNGSSTAPTNAGSYAVVASLTDPNYAGTANGTLMIAKANATFNLTPYNLIYDGNSHTATGTATGVHGEALIGLDLSQTAHTNVGSYTDSWSFTDSTGNYNNSNGVVHDSINKANVTVSVTPYSVTYDGNAHTATGTASGVKGEALSGLDLSATTHTNAGNYTDGWTFTDSTGNYNGSSGMVNDVINKTDATILVTPYDLVYDGNLHTASGTATGIGGVDLSTGLNLTGTGHTSAGTYKDSWTFTDSTGNYNPASGTVTDAIDKATPTVTWANPAAIPYGTLLTNTQLTATGSVPGTLSYNPPAGTMLNIGNHQPLVVLLTPTDSTNYNTANATAYIDVTQVTPTINWPTPADITYGAALGGTQLNATSSALGMTGWWKADGNANDSFAGNNGTLQGGTTYTTGEDGQAFSFPDATGDGVTIPLNSGYDMNSPGFVASFWMKGTQSQPGQQGGLVTILEKSHGWVDNTGWAFQASVSDGFIHFNVGQGGASPCCGQLADVPSTVNVLDGNWHFVVGTWDGQTTLSLYVDGTLQNTASTAPPANNTRGVNIGFTWGGGTPTRFFQGAVDEVKIFGNAPGKFAYTLADGTTPANGAVLNGGNGQTLNVSFTPTDAINLASASGSVKINVLKANATINVTPYNGTYDGNSHIATGTATGVQGEALSGLDLGQTAHTNAGSYTDSWSFADSTGNYNNATGTVNDSIAKANPTISVNPYSVTYDGNTHTATGTATGVKGEALSGLDLSATSHTNAGSYTDGWTFTDSSGNYNNASGSVSDVIGKANAAINVAPYSLTYDGDAHTATGTATGVKGEALEGLDLSKTTHTNAGDYPNDAWTFTDLTGNYNNSSGSVHDSIAKANATINVTSYSVTYDGNTHTATGAPTGVKGEALSGLDLSGTTHTNAGTYASDSWAFTDVTGNYNNASGVVSDAIAKANPTVNITPYSVTYDGSPHIATGTVAGVKNETLSGLDLSASTHTNAGDYQNDSWAFTDSTGNYNNASGTMHDSIAKANATITVTPYDLTYDGNPHTAVASATGVGGVDLGSGLTLSGTTHTDAGVYAADGWSFSGGQNYNDASGTVRDIINQADADISVQGYSGVYDGNAHGAKGTATGVKGENLGSLLTLGATFTDVPGGTANWSFAGNTDYKAASGSVAIVIMQAQATITVNGYTGTYDGATHGASGSAMGVKGENLSKLLSLGAGFTDVPGGTANWNFAGNTDYQPTGGSVQIVISKADSSVTANAASVTFDGNSHGGTAVAGGAGGLNQPLSLSYSGTTYGGTAYGPTPTAPIHAGSYKAIASFGGDTDHNPSSGSANFTISQASSSTAVTVAGGASFTYDSYAHPATVSVTGAGGLSLTPAPAYSCGHVPIYVADTGCIASYSFAGDNDHTGSSGSITYAIVRAPLTATANSVSMVLDASLPQRTGSLVGVLGADGITATYTTTATGTIIGTFPITPVMSDPNNRLPNYNLTLKNGTLTVQYVAVGGVCNGDYGHQILSPIAANGTSTFKQGSTIPAKFRVCDALGNSISAANASGVPVVASFNLVQIINGTVVQTVDQTVASTTPDMAFRWDSTSQQWIFNISTSNLSKSETYIYVISLNDGTSIQFQYGLPR